MCAYCLRTPNQPNLKPQTLYEKVIDTQSINVQSKMFYSIYTENLAIPPSLSESSKL